MPPKSKAQQRAAGAAYAAKKAGTVPSGGGPAAGMAASMNQKQLREAASAPQGTSKLPMRVKRRPQGRTISE